MITANKNKTTIGFGYVIVWQEGCMGKPYDPGLRNGAFIEEVLEAVIDRVKSVNRPPFQCEENQRCLEALEQAHEALMDRKARRNREGKAGTKAPETPQNSENPPNHR